MKKNIEGLENKIPDISGLVMTAVLNTKISKVKNKISDTSGLVTATFLNKKLGKFRAKYQMLVV